MRAKMRWYILLALVYGNLPPVAFSRALKAIEPAQMENINTPENFSDPDFRAVAERVVGVSPGQSFTAEQTRSVKIILCSTLRLRDLTGLHYFTGLEILDCSFNGLTDLDLAANPALATLDCSNNQLTELDLTYNEFLRELRCSDNQLTALDLSRNPNLYSLFCSNNRLSDISGWLAYPGLEQGAILDITLNHLDGGDCPDILTDVAGWVGY